MEEVNKVIDAVFSKVAQADANRPRSMQTELGVSSIGGCRRSVWHKLNGDKGTNQTLKLSSMMGTAIHKMIEDALHAEGQDLKLEIEKSVKVDGYPKGTIDLWVEGIGAVIDWKTTTKKNLTSFPSKNQLWQVHTYGFLLEELGHLVRSVTLVAIPRDGNENDIIVHTEPYDRNTALQAIEWLRDVESRLTPPEPERMAKVWCVNYCSFYGSHCDGMTHQRKGA